MWELGEGKADTYNTAATHRVIEARGVGKPHVGIGPIPLGRILVQELNN